MVCPLSCLSYHSLVLISLVNHPPSERPPSSNYSHNTPSSAFALSHGVMWILSTFQGAQITHPGNLNQPCRLNQSTLRLNDILRDRSPMISPLPVSTISVNQPLPESAPFLINPLQVPNTPRTAFLNQSFLESVLSFNQPYQSFSLSQNQPFFEALFPQSNRLPLL